MKFANPLAAIILTAFIARAKSQDCTAQAEALVACFVPTEGACGTCFADANTAVFQAIIQAGDDICAAYNIYLCPTFGCCTECGQHFSDYYECLLEEDGCDLGCDGTEGGSIPVVTPFPTPVPVVDASPTPGPTPFPVTVFTPFPTFDFDGNVADECKEEDEAWQDCILSANFDVVNRNCAECVEEETSDFIAEILSGNYCGAWGGWYCNLITCCQTTCNNQLRALVECEINFDSDIEQCDLNCAGTGSSFLGGGGSSSSSLVLPSSWSTLLVATALLGAIFS